VPPENIIKRFKLEPEMKLEQIDVMLKRIRKDLAIVRAGSPNKPSSLAFGLWQIAFPYYYFGGGKSVGQSYA